MEAAPPPLRLGFLLLFFFAGGDPGVDAEGRTNKSAALLFLSFFFSFSFSFFFSSFFFSSFFFSSSSSCACLCLCHGDGHDVDDGGGESWADLFRPGFLVSGGGNNDDGNDDDGVSPAEPEEDDDDDLASLSLFFSESRLRADGRAVVECRVETSWKRALYFCTKRLVECVLSVLVFR